MYLGHLAERKSGNESCNDAKKVSYRVLDIWQYLLISVVIEAQRKTSQATMLLPSKYYIGCLKVTEDKKKYILYSPE